MAFDLYAPGDNNQAAIRLVDFNWVAYNETRSAVFEVWNTYSGGGENLANIVFTLAPINANAAYLHDNELAQIRWSKDGVSYSSWGASVSAGDLSAGACGYMEIKVENPNHSECRGYAVFRLSSSSEREDLAGAVVWNQTPWGSFVWDGADLSAQRNDMRQPLALRAFLMDAELQSLYESAGLAFD